MTFAGLLDDAATRWPDRTALTFEGERWSFERLHCRVTLAAANLAAAGVGEGTRVLVLLENGPEYLIAQYALARLGAAFVTPNPYWTQPELVRAAEAAQAHTAIYAPRFADVISGLSVAIPVDSLADARSESAPASVDAPGAARYLPFSSGTTGLPKAVVHTDESLCGAIQQLAYHLGLSEIDRLQVALPLCHIFGTTMTAAALSVGAELTLFRRFDLDESLRHLVYNRVTIWPMAGAVAHELAARPDLDAKTFASLRFFMWGGSAVPRELAQRISSQTGVGFLCSYGMTEAMMVAFNPVHDEHRWSIDSPGFATMGTELRLDAGGELEVRGLSVASGYAGSDSDAFTRDGWFRTGDVATISPDGRLRIVDRIKDMIKVSGFQVAPAEVELVLVEHPGVHDAGVVGQPDDRAGHVPIAYVVCDPDVTAMQLDSWSQTRLASYKRPHGYHLVDELPRTAAGKLQRAELRRWHTDGVNQLNTSTNAASD
ncbi:class I adenylate-forming enzyme family protein [Mycolicibacterium hodleri]|uniref:Long-chain fatty acid--CoA ligase n=1 Tax=Mycolicibacterium hodleri TaxID=49897 RepID=A0A502EFV9_9MYCO|nr:class I adenylate-forming enzyme family protein [Mycolicibacterium hodleri]TPG36568.1 long-chain fatty acid--CoA ligase [Mycolicibacterium hodleri]